MNNLNTQKKNLSFLAKTIQNHTNSISKHASTLKKSPDAS